jgi:hypothetical protein
VNGNGSFFLFAPPRIRTPGTCTALGQSTRFIATVHPNVPPFEFRVHVLKEGEGLAEGAGLIDRIDIRSEGRNVQTIRFAGEDAPIVYAPEEAVSVKDVDCDGYKDLLVRITVGVHGDTWYHLFRFNRARGKFVAYPPFSKLPLQEVDCRSKTIKTYVNSGAAGCAYETGVYRWVNGSLSPSRIEEKTVAEDGTVTRTTRSWPNGKETVRKEQFNLNTDDNCHRADGGP